MDVVAGIRFQQNTNSNFLFTLINFRMKPFIEVYDNNYAFMVMGNNVEVGYDDDFADAHVKFKEEGKPA